MSASIRTTELKESGTELLLFVHASKKERAKSIDNRRWDPQQGCWVYPKTKRHYDAIIAEFGDELVSCPVARPLSGVPAVSNPRKADEPTRQAAFSQPAHMSSSPSAIATHAETSSVEIEKLRVELIEKNKELSKVSAQLSDASLSIAGLKKTLESKEVELKSSRDRYEQQSQESATKSSNGGNSNGKTYARVCKDLAEVATGANTFFMEKISPLPLDGTFPIELGKYLEDKLRTLLECPDRSLSLHDLIMQAKDAELLPDEAIDMAHTIRKQRNIAAHSRLDPQVQVARVLLCLFAASILWPQLPD